MVVDVNATRITPTCPNPPISVATAVVLCHCVVGVGHEGHGWLVGLGSETFLENDYFDLVYLIFSGFPLL